MKLRAAHADKSLLPCLEYAPCLVLWDSEQPIRTHLGGLIQVYWIFIEGIYSGSIGMYQDILGLYWEARRD